MEKKIRGRIINPVLPAVLLLLMLWMSNLVEGTKCKFKSYTAATAAAAAIITCIPQPNVCHAIDLYDSPAYASYTFQPSSRAPSGEPPLRYITPATLISEGEEKVRAAFDEVKKAAMPRNIDTFVAIIAAETTAGVVGGISSRKVADALKDNKRDDISTKALSSGAFFGARGFSRCFIVFH